MLNLNNKFKVELKSLLKERNIKEVFMMVKIIKGVVLIVFNLFYAFMIYQAKDSFICVYVGAGGVMGWNWLLMDLLDRVKLRNVI